MRFTKIPLIATLMAVALSLLIVLPGLAQTSDITDGKLSNVDITVGVFDNIADAQTVKLEAAGGTSAVKGVYVPLPAENITPSNDDTHTMGDPAFLLNPEYSPQDTLFRNTLYASNMMDAYDTVLINVETVLGEYTGTCDADGDGKANVTATVKNNRSGGAITIQLDLTGNGKTQDDFQAFFRIIPDGGTNSNGPMWCVESGSTATSATSATDASIAAIAARDGDRLTITSTGGSGQVEIVVDGEGPEFSAITPEDNAVLRSSRLTFRFEVRDDDSGLRHDGESVISPDGDYDEINPDNDQYLGSEPLSENPGTTIPGNGPAADINVNVIVNGMNDTMPADTDDISASGTWAMAGSRAGVAYTFTASGADRDDESYLYQLTAKDRAGNVSKTDADLDSDGVNEPFVFRVDDTDPILNEARTGIAYDTDKNVEKADRSYVALSFTGDALSEVDTGNITVVGHTIVGYTHPTLTEPVNRGEQPGQGPQQSTYTANLTDPSTVTLQQTEPPMPTNPRPAQCDPATSEDKNDCQAWSGYDKNKTAYDEEQAGYQATLDAWNDALALYDAEVKKYESETFTPAKDIEGENIEEPRSYVYLELAEDLASDATPTVLVVGGAAYDLAGNTNESKTLEKAADWIAPRLTVTVMGSGVMGSNRPVAADDADGSFTIDVRSDEDLSRRPAVHFASLVATEKMDDNNEGTGEYTYEIGEAASIGSLTQQEDDNHWAKKFKAQAISVGVNGAGLIGVIVSAKDGVGNSAATAGWSPGMHQDAVAPMGMNGLDLGKLDDAGLLVEIDDGFAEAERADGYKEAFVTPRSNDMGTVTESANPFVKLDFSPESAEYMTGGYKDSHSTVNVTEITLDGEDVMAQLARVSSNEFSLVLRDLAVDKYKVSYTVEDDAGHEDEGSFTFTVEERQPYEVAVSPGWNLISIPATPLEPEIESVLADNPYISPVLGYQDGDWITAIQEENGTWRGRLEMLEGGYGYWVHARTFETIETMLSEIDPAETLPTVPVTQGWNLLGVLDVQQNDAGDAPGAAGGNGDEADNYLSSISWRVAYTYATDKSLWVKTTPDDGDSDTSEMDGDSVLTEIRNGKGYWVWSNTPGVLAP